MQTATIAHERPTLRRGLEISERIDTVLARHASSWSYFAADKKRAIATMAQVS